MTTPNDPDQPNVTAISKLRSTPTSTRAGYHLLFFLRFIQLGATCITGFVYCYLVWHHNNHYCAFYPYYCTAVQRSYVRAPREYIFVITVCCIVFLEVYISAAWFVARDKVVPSNRVYKQQLLTSSPAFLAFVLALWRILRNPRTSGTCWFLEVPTSLLADVEARNCVAVVDGYVSLSIAVGFTGFVVLMCATVTGKNAMKAVKAIKAREGRTAASHEREKSETQESADKVLSA